MPLIASKIRRGARKKKLFGQGNLAAAALDFLESVPPRVDTSAVEKYAAGIRQLKFQRSYGRGLLKMNLRLNLDPIARLMKFIRVLTYRRVTAGFYSRAKKLKRKRFWAIYGGPPGVDRVPPRSPFPALARSESFKKLKQDFAMEIRDAALKYYNARRGGQSAGSPVGIRNTIYKKYANRLAALARRKMFFSQIQPPLKKGGTPLWRTGALAGSIRGRVKR